MTRRRGGVVFPTVLVGLVVLAGCPPEPTVRDGGGVPDAGPAQAPVLASPPDAPDIDPDDDTVHFVLRAGALDGRLAHSSRQYGYNDMSPGPTLRAQVGQRVVIDFENTLDVPTTVHWHGVSVPWAMDGATWMMAPIAPGASFQYVFDVEVAGTFWYHPHFNTDRQIDLGLYGAFIVEDPNDPVPDDELIVFFDTESETTADGGVTSALGKTWTANGFFAPEYRTETTSVVRLRTINANNERYVDVDGEALRHIGSDQGLRSVVESGAVVMAPGDRSDFELLVGPTTTDVVSHGHSIAGAGPAAGEEPIFSVAAQSGEMPQPLSWGGAMQAPSPAPDNVDIVYVLAGSPESGEWRINGEAFPNVTIESIALGDTVHILVRNLSATEHPFHIHGHAFEVVSIGGVPPAQRTIEDTINVPVQGDIVIKLVADNPGEWMTHCHILSHAEGGMMTVIRVLAD